MQSLKSQNLWATFRISDDLKGKELDLTITQIYPYLIGIDEVGRGCLAGPVISCAIILKQTGFDLVGLNDSKKLTEQQRLSLFPHILEHTQLLGIGFSSEQEIDHINILEATKLSMYRALYNLDLKQNHQENTVLLVDGLYLPYSSFASFKLIKGDQKSPTIMAASIVAKVVRDSLMQLYHNAYPEYHFKQNKGYGTPHHKNLILQGQYSPIHRKSFSPLKDFFGE